MKPDSSKGSPRYTQPPLLTTGQTFLWFAGGIVAMFLMVSVIFAAKLGVEGRLPGLGSSVAPPSVEAPSAGTAPAAATPAVNTPVSPPVSSTASAAEQGVSPTLIRPDANATFVPGTENVLPAEVAHLAKDAPATSPAPATAAPGEASSSAMATEEIQRSLSAWAAAWERKDADGYLKHYAPDFQPGAGLSHAAWLKQRRERLGRAGDISVKLSEFEINSDGPTATAHLMQTYTAQGRTLREAKTLALALHDGQWLIQEERLGR